MQQGPVSKKSSPSKISPSMHFILSSFTVVTCEWVCAYLHRVIDDHAVQNDAKKTLWRLSVYDTYLNYDEVRLYQTVHYIYVL